MDNNSRLNETKEEPFGDFYTLMADISNEMENHKEQFRGKVVGCNCDDPTASNFPGYFISNYNRLGLAGIVATCYRNQTHDMFSEGKSKRAVYYEHYGNPAPDINNIEPIPLKGDGDCLEKESLDLMKEVDIICTNPPFGKPVGWRHLVKCMEMGKDVVVLGFRLWPLERQVFPHFKSGRMAFGLSSRTSGDMLFRLPEWADHTQFHSGCVDEDGLKFAGVQGVRWFTTLPSRKLVSKREYTALYNEAVHPNMTNYNAIFVKHLADTPIDYDGVMGVPPNYFDHPRPDLFEVVGATNKGQSGDTHIGGPATPIVNGKNKFRRILIRRRK